MNDRELELLREATEDMFAGKLSKREQILLVLGVQAGLYSNDPAVSDLLAEIAEFCLAKNINYSSVGDIKSYDN